MNGCPRAPATRRSIPPRKANARWTRVVPPILGEHPRPTMVRDNCTMLNGWWDYAIASIPEDETAPKWRKTAAMLTRDEAVRAVKETAIPQTFDGKILVPFSPESALSGVHQTIYPDNLLWYRTVVHPSRSAEEGNGPADRRRESPHPAFRSGRLCLRLLCQRPARGQAVGGYRRSTSIFRHLSTLMTRLKSRCASTIRTIRARSCAASRKSSAKASGTPRKAAFGKSVWLEIVPEAYLRTLTLKGGIRRQSCSSVRKSAATSRTRNCTSSSPTLRTARWWRMRRCRRACARCVRKSQQLPNICGRRPIRICMTCGPNCDTGRRNPRKRRVMRRSRNRSRWMS